MSILCVGICSGAALPEGDVQNIVSIVVDIIVDFLEPTDKLTFIVFDRIAKDSLECGSVLDPGKYSLVLEAGNARIADDDVLFATGRSVFCVLPSLEDNSLLHNNRSVVSSDGCPGN